MSDLIRIFESTLRFLALLLYSVFLIDCSSASEVRSQTSRQIPVVMGKSFLVGHTGEHKQDSQEILQIMNRLVAGTISKNLDFLPELVSEKEGLFIDVKGQWTKEQLRSELLKDQNYFQIYFFENELLQKQKGKKEVRTVRELFLASGGIEADFYYEGPLSCEVKLRFLENKKLESELINPYFVKIGSKWVLIRLF
ncbi:hypothetical protein CH373_09105 [Leptospira perolatii]|uniref:Uncharacterized protein n=1 Tax=Leptospira perolatii TaxID=2023191 RepID=A0A2M9ZNM3_9LEPT|nr:hypothetical protein [Leptospira perolatii]PJZ69647.1 hypothetical protein CH360_10250 [Leptospira perolatii]PJZ73634.1 hypothetical protein CH373_09105 [Leptospira perolatii]